MSRFDDTEAAVLRRLRILKAKPEMTINRVELETSLFAEGFPQEDVLAVLQAFEQENIVAFGPGQRLLIRKTLPR